MPFAIKIHSTNAATAYARTADTKWTANPSQKSNWGWAYKGETHDGVRAQFATRAEAHEVACACRWSNQTFEVVVVRGEVNSVVSGQVYSCQG